jgi:hypothetical protein
VTTPRATASAATPKEEAPVVPLEIFLSSEEAVVVSAAVVVVVVVGTHSERYSLARLQSLTSFSATATLDGWLHSVSAVVG